MPPGPPPSRPWPRLTYRELATARLHLRRPRGADAPLFLARLGADPEVMRFLRWRPHVSLAHAEAAVARRLERLERGIEYSWILEPLVSRAGFGVISAWREGDALELGFVLARDVWEQGFATEATIAVREWALESGAVARVWATCDAANPASARVLEKAGLAPRGRYERDLVRPNLGPAPRPSLYFVRER